GPATARLHTSRRSDDARPRRACSNVGGTRRALAPPPMRTTIALLLLASGCVAPPEDGEVVTAESAGCSQLTTVVVYSEDTYQFTLPDALAASVDRCTQVYVNLIAPAGDKTQIRPGADKVHQLGPNFHAVAEFSWGAWRNWIKADR